MSTEFFNDQWRIPSNENQSKQSNYSMYGDTSGEINASGVPLSSESWTIAVWLKPNVTTGNEIIWDMQYGSAGGFKLIHLYGTSTATAVFFLYYAPTYSNFNSQVTITKNNWHHVIVRYNKGVDYRIYVDGVFSGSSTTFNNYSYPTTRDLEIFKIGGFNGNLDQFCVFDYALSDTSTNVGDTATGQIATLYGGGSAMANPMSLSSPPQAYYQLGEESVSTGPSSDYLVPNASLQDYVFDFSGGTDIISYSNINLTGNRTVSFWVNINSPLTSAIYLGSGGNDYYPYMTATSVILKSSTQGSSSITQPSIVTGKWYHYCITGDGTNATLYRDGLLIGTLADKSLIINTIGGTPTGSSDINAKMSNVQIFNTALSGPEVTTLYNYGSPIRTLASIPQSSNLNAWYKLDATATFDSSTGNWTILDDSTNSNTGTSSGMTQANLVQSNLQHTSGYSPYALDFDGVGDYMPLNSNINLTGDRTISFWVNLNSTATAYLFASNNNDYYPLITASSVLIRSIAEGSTSFSQPNIVTGVWYHYCITGDGTNATLYRDGLLIDTGTDRSPIINTIGASATGAAPVNAKMSNVAIWTNTVLSQSEVTEIYNQGVPSNLNNFSGTAPTHWWQLGSNSSFNTNWTCLDEIGTNNGVSVNMTAGDIVNGPGYSANGLGASTIDILGDAPYSTANGLSENMDVLDRTKDVPPTV